MGKVRQSLHNSQDGLVAIFSVLMIMGILTLLTIGFSALTRQAQRRAIDDQLATQAYYAAETGVNRAVAATITGSNNECDTADSAVAPPGIREVIDSANDIQIPCLLIKGQVSDQEHVVKDTALVSEFQGTTAINRIAIEWDSENELAPAPIRNAAVPEHTHVLAWNGAVSPIRVDLLPISATGTRDQMIQSTRTVFLYPTTVAFPNPPVPWRNGVNEQGEYAMVTCNNTSGYRCRAVIDTNGLNGYYFRIQRYYTPIRTRVTPLDSGGTVVNVTSGQRIIDATGQANDVFKRIQVRVSSNTTASHRVGLHEAFGLTSGDSLCKRYLGAPGTTEILPHSDVPATETACDLP